MGSHMAQELSAMGHSVTLVEVDPGVAGRRRDVPSVELVTGDACDVDVLAAAGTVDADVVAAVTGDDEDNLVVSLLAKQEFGVPRVIARVNNPKNEWMFNEMWGVDVSVSTPHLLTALVEEAVTVGSFVHLMKLEHGQSGLCGVTLAEGSPAADTAIRDIGLPREASVVAVVRDGHVVQPNGDLVLRLADEVIVLARTGAEQSVRDALVGGGQ